MKHLSKLAAYFFPHDSGDISLLLLAIAAAASSAGIVSIGLLVAHPRPALPTVDGAQRDCLERCEKMCSGPAR
ncbi:hypothetical protein [Paraburkholderia elongata]|uniref:Uncharacterized protein n=1 Tax=Paraburkholderia elongata TaxID=2675747 RepID=A0A972NWH0_9BURK|nr:hypothetical protein [Paraburkholderia elongata]NPT61113.1 hypothetical protein [Paraburkholderia elongata]